MSRGPAKRRLLASVAGAALAAGCGTPLASAQTVNWTGFYAGLYAGWAWTRSNATTTVPCTAPSLSGYLCDIVTGPTSDSNAVAANGSGKLFDSHFTGGAHAGYNWQAGNFVFGGEVDFGAFLLNASRSVTARYNGTAPGPANGDTYTIGTSIDADWLFTARGRVGYATGNALFYATGGLAVTRLTVANTFSDNVTATGGTGATGGGSNSSIRVGYAVGGGAERHLSRDWSVKVEYLYLDFGCLTVLGLITNAGGYSQALNTAFDISSHVVRAGFNYRF